MASEKVLKAVRRREHIQILRDMAMELAEELAQDVITFTPAELEEYRALVTEMEKVVAQKKRSQ